MAQEETTTKTEVGYLDCVKLFAETMKEKYLDGKENSLILIAGNGERIYMAKNGRACRVLESFVNAMVQEEQIKMLVDMALSVIELCKKGMPIETVLKLVNDLDNQINP